MSGLVQDLKAGVVVNFRPHFLCNAFQHSEQFGVFLFGEQIDLKIQIVTPLSKHSLMVLTDEDEGREENGFERNNESKKGKGIGIEMVQACRGVEKDPPSEPEHMHPDEGRAAKN